MTPTVLIFLKAPIPGQVKTRLAVGVGEAVAREIYDRLVRRQLAAIPTGWPVEVHFAPAEQEPMVRAWLGESEGRSFHPQIPAGLGQRLIHAGLGASARGADALFFIGGDCPALDADIFQRAAEALRHNPAVLGPTADGGYYLLGLARMNPPLFADIAWGTGQVAEQTRAQLRRAGWTWGELPVLRDVDTAEDWRALAPLVEGS